MLKILIMVFLLLLIYRVVKVRSYKNSRQRFAAKSEEAETTSETFEDPVCGKKLSRADAFLLRQGDDVYGFCSKKCMRTWQHSHNAGWKM